MGLLTHTFYPFSTKIKMRTFDGLHKVFLCQPLLLLLYNIVMEKDYKISVRFALRVFANDINCVNRRK